METTLPAPLTRPHPFRRRLWGLNVSAAVLHGVLAIVLLVVFLRNRNDAELSYTLQGKPASQHPGAPTLWVPLFLVLFLALTAVAHTAYAVLPGYYREVLDRGRNSFRWGEYSITATLMVVAIALLCQAFRSWSDLVMIVTATVFTMACGFVVEHSLPAAQRSGAFAVPLAATGIGWGLTTAVWTVIILRFLVSIRDARNKSAASNGEKEGPPKFVYGVVFPMFILFSCFGVVSLLQIRAARRASAPSWKRGSAAPAGETGKAYTPYELGYVTLSFVAKAFLAIWVAVGLLSRGRNERDDP